MTIDQVLDKLEQRMRANGSSNKFEIETSKNQPFKVCGGPNKEINGNGPTIAAALENYLKNYQAKVPLKSEAEELHP